MKFTGTKDDIIRETTYLEADKQYDIEIKEHKGKRSINANNYYWQLITKIANSLQISKEEAHMTMLKRYSQVSAVMMPSEYTLKGMIKYYEIDGHIRKNGKDFTTYKVYKPSSEMDTYEMSKLIDGTVSEAKELGIETLSPEEIERIKKSWKDYIGE